MKKKIWFILPLVILLIAVFVAPIVQKKDSCQKNVVTKHTASAKQLVTTRKKAKSAKLKHADPTAHWTSLTSPVKIPILMYHSISDKPGNSLCIPPEQFANQIKWLKQNHYYMLTPTQAYLVLKTNKVPSKKIVWVTLDDGYLNNYTAVYPVIKQLNSKVTINMITGFSQNQGMLTLQDLKTMKKSGLVTISSHTVHHEELNTLTAEQQKQELVASKAWLDSNLKQNTNMICYPVGRYNDATAILASQAGYKLGLTTTPGFASASQGLFALHRLRVTPGMSNYSFSHLASTY
ncbi:polysaccharide deacetylase family protein [Lactobacillus sp. UCMA15818]|uniref:polysaccharide deacetylase family protein n=1 Tax=Lactobacillus sp. UCMA15818 TaxID=2583394 RepID=UPI0025AF47BE|nr:polysaccharide deacetylase family protein [Lactobacillus sp. UCMA15818]MDN2453916.1 polysaccharide deacetylase family protein [Lactobacillus sp. UCMA15818]